MKITIIKLLSYILTALFMVCFVMPVAFIYIILRIIVTSANIILQIKQNHKKCGSQTSVIRY